MTVEKLKKETEEHIDFIDKLLLEVERQINRERSLGNIFDDLDDLLNGRQCLNDKRQIYIQFIADLECL